MKYFSETGFPVSVFYVIMSLDIITRRMVSEAEGYMHSPRMREPGALECAWWIFDKREQI